MGVIVVSLVQPVTVRHICCTCPEQLDLHRKHLTQTKTWWPAERHMMKKLKGSLKLSSWLDISFRKVINNVSPPYFLRHHSVHFFCSKIHKDIQCNQNTSFQQRMSTNCERRGNKSVRSMFHIAILFPVSSYSLLDLWSPVCRLLQVFVSIPILLSSTTAALLVYLGSFVSGSNLWLQMSMSRCIWFISFDSL